MQNLLSEERIRLSYIEKEINLEKDLEKIKILEKEKLELIKQVFD